MSTGQAPTRTHEAPLSGAPSLATAQSGKTAWPSCRDPRRAHPADAGSSPWGAADVVTPLRWARRFGLLALLCPAAGRDGRAQYAFSWTGDFWARPRRHMLSPQIV